LAAEGAIAEAATAIEQALVFGQDQAPLLCFLAELLLKQDQKEAALEASERALEHNPYLGEAWGVRAAALVALGQYSEAQGVAERALGLNPYLASACIAQARALLGMQRYRQAVAVCERALRFHSENAELLECQAAALRGEHQTPD
jgi:tetratricopeptide (TPR) repeat protein